MVDRRHRHHHGRGARDIEPTIGGAAIVSDRKAEARVGRPDPVRPRGEHQLAGRDVARRDGLPGRHRRSAERERAGARERGHDHRLQRIRRLVVWIAEGEVGELEDIGRILERCDGRVLRHRRVIDGDHRDGHRRGSAGQRVRECSGRRPGVTPRKAELIGTAVAGIGRIADRILSRHRQRAERRLRDDDQRKLVRRRLQIVTVQHDRKRTSGDRVDADRIGHGRLIYRRDIDGQSSLGLAELVVLGIEADRIGAGKTAAGHIGKRAGDGIEVLDRAVLGLGDDAEGDGIAVRVGRAERHRKRRAGGGRERGVGNDRQLVGRAVDVEGAHEGATRGAVAGAVERIAGGVEDATIRAGGEAIVAVGQRTVDEIERHRRGPDHICGRNRTMSEDEPWNSTAPMST